jgi:hypothetical protein
MVHSQDRVEASTKASHTAGGFSVSIDGTWREDGRANPRRLHIDLIGKQKGESPDTLSKFWKKIWATVQVEGTVWVDGIVDAAPIKGTLKLLLVEFLEFNLAVDLFNLAVDFSDAQGESYSIHAKTLNADRPTNQRRPAAHGESYSIHAKTLNAATSHTLVKGTLKRGAIQIDEVDLWVDLSDVKRQLGGCP